MADIACAARPGTSGGPGLTIITDPSVKPGLVLMLRATVRHLGAGVLALEVSRFIPRAKP